MNIQRFTAPTAREAMALARNVFGDGTLILSNRQLDDGVEVVAAAEDSLSALEAGRAILQGTQGTLSAPAWTPPKPVPAPAVAQPQPAAPAPAPAPLASAESRAIVEADVAELGMSTLSFQDYVRERMLRRQQEAASPAPAPAASSAAPVRAAFVPTAAPAAVETPRPAPIAAPAPAIDTASETQQALMAELQAMRTLMESRFNALAWLGPARQNPVHSNLMLKLLRAGYSPALARSVLESIALDNDAAGAVRRMMAALETMLGIDPAAPTLAEEGGVYALVGATGVGKTTTAAKIAAQCARLHGPASVGLITLDMHRAGAHEQLRAHGRAMGVVAHLAHDRAALQELLALFHGKRMVLIDTAGLAPRDPRRRDLLDLLDLPGIARLMVLNAGAHGDTLDEMAASFKIGGARQAVLSKTDEAVKLGPALDTLIRHQLVLRGVAHGPRTSQDWKPALAAELVRDSMRAAQRSPFDPQPADLELFFSPGAGEL